MQIFLENVKTFDELVSLFKRQTDIPAEEEFPDVKPCSETYEFPKHIMTAKHMCQALKDIRIERIRHYNS